MTERRQRMSHEWTARRFFTKMCCLDSPNSLRSTISLSSEDGRLISAVRRTKDCPDYSTAPFIRVGGWPQFTFTKGLTYFFRFGKSLNSLEWVETSVSHSICEECLVAASLNWKQILFIEFPFHWKFIFCCILRLHFSYSSIICCSYEELGGQQSLRMPRPAPVPEGNGKVPSCQTE